MLINLALPLTIVNSSCLIYLLIYFTYRSQFPLLPLLLLPPSTSPRPAPIRSSFVSKEKGPLGASKPICEGESNVLGNVCVEAMDRVVKGGCLRMKMVKWWVEGYP